MRRICYLALFLLPLALCAQPTCNPYYVRWPRVKLNFKAVANARLNLRACESACSLGEDPLVPGRKLECAALNHHPSPDGFSHHCDVFQPHQLQNVDGYVEADDRYSFYWKYCLNSTRKCGADYAFTFLSDRYMDHSEVIRVVKMSSLEECLTECLEETSFPCRSISFNRTDGGCHLSANSQLTKPGSVKLNNNPNFRIDYYENNCYNLSESFKFEQECREDGILIRVKSKFPYTGALYGLYDFFTCRIEPKEQNSFEYLFPSPTSSKNCSDSIRFKGNEMVLEVVLSTDGVEPLYFITPDDLTYQAKCPIQRTSKISAPQPIKPINDASKQMEASTHALFSMLAKETTVPKKEKETFQLPLTTPRSVKHPTVTSTTTRAPPTTTTKAPTTTTTRAPTTTTTIPTTTTTRASTTTTSSTTTTTTTTTPRPTTTTKAPTTKPTTTSTTTTTTTTTRPPTTTTKTTTKATTPTKHIITAAHPTVPSTTARSSSRPVQRGSVSPPGSSVNIVTTVKEPVSFDIYKDGRPVDAVVVGSKISFAFTPHYPIPADHMSIIGCQSEPVDPKYDWEKEILPIIKDSCPVDFVGLVCPPSQSDSGLKVVVESFRYQTTPQVLYTCLIRICPFGACPKQKCPEVDGCPSQRTKRALSLEQIREALERDPDLARQFGITASMLTNKPLSLEQQLMALSGDHVVQRRLVVVNSEDQLKYFVNTGDLP